MSNVIETTDKTFETDVLKSDLPVVVRFGAVWCGPCRAFAPVFAAAADELAGKIKFVDVDVDACKDVTATQAIRGVPTVKIFKGGEAVTSAAGSMAKSQLYELLARAVPELVGLIATGNGMTATTRPEGTGTSV